MKLGLGSFALAWAIGVPGHAPARPLDVYGFVELAAEHGFGLVQIADNLPLHELSQGRLARLARLLHDRDIEVEVGTRGVANDNLARYVDLARTLRSSILRVVVDSADHHPEPAEVVAAIRRVLPDLEAADVVLAVENHDRFRARDLREIIRTLDSRHVGVCLDTVNSFGALEGPEVVLETLGPHVVNLHVKDFEVEREPHAMGFRITGAPAGQGRLDVPRLLTALEVEARGIGVILELWPPPAETLAATVRRERRWLEASAAYLHGLAASGP